MSTALHSGPGDGVSFERELLYKVLFDLRADVNDLKRMLTELMQRAERPAEPTKDLAGLLPHSIASPDYTESEEVVDEQPSRELTKPPRAAAANPAGRAAQQRPPPGSRCRAVHEGENSLP